MTQRAKNILSILAVLIAGYLIAAYYLNLWPATGIEEGRSGSRDREVVCAQVITFAVNPETGKIEEFATPCDVPDGWTTVEADILEDKN